MSTRRAFCVEVSGLGHAIVSAVSRGQAASIAMESLRDANYIGYNFTDLRCARIPKYDPWASTQTLRKTWCEEFVRNP